MSHRPALLASIVAALLWTAPSRAAETLTFAQVLARVEQAQRLAPSADASAAAQLLESAPRLHFPTLRIEASATSANSVDFLSRNIFPYDAYTSLLSADYTLLDGGIRAAQLQLSRLEAQSFRQRLQASGDAIHRETLEAVAALYSAQERLRILDAGLARAIGLRERAAELLDAREISNITAAQWEDESAGAETQLLQLELQRLEAETRVRHLMNDPSADALTIVLDLDGAPPPPATAATIADFDPSALNASLASERTRLALDEAEAARRVQLTLSAFGGVTALSDEVSGDGGYGLFGVRFTLALPMFDSTLKRRAAEARLRAEAAELDRRAVQNRVTAQSAALDLGAASLEKRIALLERLVAVAQRRETSLGRLATEGIRAENEVANAAADRARRESDLLDARVSLWKLRQSMQPRTESR